MFSQETEAGFLVMITAQQAKELIPRGYASNDRISELIFNIAKAGGDYLWHDLTREQILQFRGLGFRIDDEIHHSNKFAIAYKIDWSHVRLNSEINQ